MPIGTTGNPPGFAPRRDPDIVSRVILFIGSLIGVVVSGGAAFAASLVRAISQGQNDVWPNEPLTPQECAVGVVKNTIPGGDWEGEARLSGIDPERFRALVGLTGNPPGPETLLTMINRNIINADEARQGMKEGFLRNDWIEQYMRLQQRVLSQSEVVQAAVQGHLEDADARRRWEQADGDPADYDVAYATAGNPPGVQQMLSLWRRGYVTQAEVEQAIRESRLKNKYIPAVLHLAEYVPPPRTITTLLSHGAIDTIKAHQLFQANGLTDEMATAYVASALHTKTASQKELSVGQVTALYTDGIITRPEALDDLHKVGYGDPEANLVLDLAERRAEQAVRTRVVNRVREMFVTRKIDLATAQADLAKLKVDSAQTERLLTVWQIEQQAPTRTLTLGQLNAAYKAELIPHDDYIARVMNLGYDAADADLLSKIVVPPETP